MTMRLFALGVALTAKAAMYMDSSYGCSRRSKAVPKRAAESNYQKHCKHWQHEHLARKDPQVCAQGQSTPVGSFAECIASEDEVDRHRRSSERYQGVGQPAKDGVIRGAPGRWQALSVRAAAQEVVGRVESGACESHEDSHDGGTSTCFTTIAVVCSLEHQVRQDVTRHRLRTVAACGSLCLRMWW